MPRSAAISWVTSTGKPKVSWSLKATSPGTWPGSLAKVSSSSVTPRVRVVRKPPSSRSTMPSTKSRLAARSG